MKIAFLPASESLCIKSESTSEVRDLGRLQEILKEKADVFQGECTLTVRVSQLINSVLSK